MNKRKIMIIGFVFIFIIGCSQGQQTDKMKQTSQKLVAYLKNSDSNSIKKLMRDPYMLRDKSDFYTEDFKTFNMVSNKYGAPSLDSFHIKKGENGENVFIIPLMAKGDSLINIKKCDLVIFFYPEKFSTYDQIYTYHIYKQPYKKKEPEFIKAEPLPNFKKN